MFEKFEPEGQRTDAAVVLRLFWHHSFKSQNFEFYFKIYDP